MYIKNYSATPKVAENICGGNGICLLLGFTQEDVAMVALPKKKETATTEELNKAKKKIEDLKDALARQKKYEMELAEALARQKKGIRKGISRIREKTETRNVSCSKVF